MACRQTIASLERAAAQRVALALAFAALIGVTAPSAFAEPTRCDVLAGLPLDPHKVAVGVTFEQLNPRPAIEACTKALQADPQNPRLRFELGRALERTGAYAEAVTAYRNAAGMGYAAAQNALGAMYQDGLGVKADPAEAQTWFKRAADQGYQPAVANLVALMPPKPAPAAPPTTPTVAVPVAPPIAAPAAPVATPIPDTAPAVAPLPAAPVAVPPPVEPAAPPTEAAPPAPPPTPAPVPTGVRPVPVKTPPAAPPPAPPAKEEAALAPPPAPASPPAAAPTSPPPPPPHAAEPPSNAIAALPTDPQSIALSQCILPEAQKGDAALDEAQAANLLVGKCQGQWLAWVNSCVDQGDSKANCIRKSTSFARAAVQQHTTN